MKTELTKPEILRYSRHLTIPQVGLKGQQKLKSTSVLIVGSGGLGSPVSLYLAAAGIGHIGIVDFDTVDETNLQRQIIHDTSHIGSPKVDSARQRLAALNPYIQVDVYNTVLSSANAREIGSGYDIFVDGSDNFATRYLLNDLSVLTGKPFVYGSIFRFEGQVSVFDARSGPCYRCLFPQPPQPDSVPACGDAGVFGILPGTIGTLQATEVIKLALGIGEPLIGKLLLYNAMEMSFQTINFRKNPTCTVCGERPEIKDLVDYDAFCGIPSRYSHPDLLGGGLDILPIDLYNRLRQGDPIQLIDVRDPVEQQISALEGALNIPVEQITLHEQELDREKEYVLFCRTGVRSTQAANQLLGIGFKHVLNLQGGINAWAKDIDGDMPVY